MNTGRNAWKGEHDGDHRRQLIGVSGAFAASLAIGRHFACAAGGYPFTLGVASGEPAADGFVLWTRLALDPLAPDGQGGMTDPVPVVWEVAADETMGNVVRRGTVEAGRRLAHSVRVEVSGLEPNRPYWYRFTALGEQSAIGRARTAPAASTRLDRFRFAFASCSNWQMGYFSAYRHMAEENPDLILFLGDYIYEFTYGGAAADRVLRPHDGPTATDLAGYRNRHALYKTDPELQARERQADEHFRAARLRGSTDAGLICEWSEHWGRDAPPRCGLIG
jgi:alkaline phosphatase D